MLRGRGKQLKVVEVEGKARGKLSVTDGSDNFARDLDSCFSSDTKMGDGITHSRQA
jgi:hypothetical protein